MSEARRRPRPAQVQPSAEDNAEDLGLRAEYVEVDGSDGSVDADDLEHVPLVKPDVQYQPRLHVDQGDVLTLAHRLTVKTGGPGKVSASTQRATEFVKQYAEKYVEIQRPRACHREDASGDVPMSMPLRQGDIHMGLKHQSNLLEARKEKDVQAGAESDHEFTTHISSREIEAGVAPFARVLTLSPAEKAMQLLQQKLPVVTDVVTDVAAVASGSVSNFAISGDQYNVVILAIAPLQRLWEKAKDKQMVSYFGDPTQIEKLLDLVTPVPVSEFHNHCIFLVLFELLGQCELKSWFLLLRDLKLLQDMVSRIFVHGPGGSGKTFMLNEVILPVYEEYLPGMSKGVAAQNSAARLIGGSTFHHMDGLGRKQDLLLKKPTRDRREALRKKWRRVALLFHRRDFIDTTKFACRSARIGLLGAMRCRPWTINSWITSLEIFFVRSWQVIFCSSIRSGIIPSWEHLESMCPESHCMRRWIQCSGKKSKSLMSTDTMCFGNL